MRIKYLVPLFNVLWNSKAFCSAGQKRKKAERESGTHLRGNAVHALWSCSEKFFMLEMCNYEVQSVFCLHVSLTG
jgi:hypothetical protein